MAKDDENRLSGGLEGDIDTRLLNQDKKEKEKAGALQEAKRKGRSQDSDNYLTEEPQSLRQAVIQKRKKKELELKQKKTSLLAKVSPARKGMSALLRAAWINLITTFGLTLIWINIHVFLGMIFGNGLFCKLGEEWTDRGMGKSGAAKEAIDKKARNSVGLVEKVGLGCLNLGCLFLIIGFLAQVALIMNFGDYLWEATKVLSGFAWDYVKGLLTGN